MDLIIRATSVEFESATKAEQELWKKYVMYLLPCSHGRGAGTFWKVYEKNAGLGETNDLDSMIELSDHALALAAVDTKRKEAVENQPRRGRGAPNMTERNPITAFVFNAYYDELGEHLHKLKGCWKDQFPKWVEEDRQFIQTTRQVAEGNAGGHGYARCDEAMMDRAIERMAQPKKEAGSSSKGSMMSSSDGPLVSV